MNRILGACAALLLAPLLVLPAEPASASAPVLPTISTPERRLPKATPFAIGTTTIPVVIYWRVTRGGTSGACSFTVFRQTYDPDTGAWSNLTRRASVTKTEYTEQVSVGSAGRTTNRAGYRYVVFPVDCAGRTGDGVLGAAFWSNLHQENDSFWYGGPNWGIRADARFSGGSSRVNSTKKTYAEGYFCYWNAGLVATTGPRGGIVELTVDGIAVGQVSLYSPTTKYRQVVMKTFTPDGSCHTVRVVNASTSATRNTLSLDAFVTLTPL